MVDQNIEKELQDELLELRVNFETVSKEVSMLRVDNAELELENDRLRDKNEELQQ